jgi:hypothetical protein
VKQLAWDVLDVSGVVKPPVIVAELAEGYCPEVVCARFKPELARIFGVTAGVVYYRRLCSK